MVLDATTGVIDANACQDGIWDEIHDREFIDLGMLEHRKECHDEDCMHEVGGVILFGDWKKSWVWLGAVLGSQGLPIRYEVVPAYTPWARRQRTYVPRQDGSYGYSARYNKDEYTIQVMWSQWVQRDARWCSPCYPHQASIGETEGSAACYLLPARLHVCFVCKDRRQWETVYCADGWVRCWGCALADGFNIKEGNELVVS